MTIITGGGTGGHLSIIKALKEEIILQNEKVIYVGSIYGQDYKWFSEDSDFHKVYFLPMRGFAGKNIFYKILFMISLVYSLIYLSFIFYKYKVSKVIGVGGYSSAPSSLLAVLLRKKLYLHEQNSVDGGVNKWLKKYSYKYFNSFKTNHPYPINKDFFAYARERGNISTILFLGGSNGASFINNLAISLAKELNNKQIKIIHQSGLKDYNNLKQFYQDENINANLFDFSNDLPHLMNQADFCISRSGASTTFELLANNLPTLFIPFPYAIYDHQYKNALYFKKQNLCFLKRENELTNEYIYELIQNNFKDLSANLRNSCHINGAKKIIEEIYQ